MASQIERQLTKKIYENQTKNSFYQKNTRATCSVPKMESLLHFLDLGLLVGWMNLINKSLQILVEPNQVCFALNDEELVFLKNFYCNDFT